MARANFHNAAIPTLATTAAVVAATASSLAVISVSEIGSTEIAAAAASEAFVSLGFFCRHAFVVAARFLVLALPPHCSFSWTHKKKEIW